MNTGAGGNSQINDRGYAASGRACPRCNGAIQRVPRRFADYLVSVFMTVHRYRCNTMNCGWEGCLRAKRHPLSGEKPGATYHERIYVLGTPRMGEVTKSESRSDASTSQASVQHPRRLR